MRQTLRFLLTAALAITPISAMEEQQPRSTGWEDVPTELQQDIIDRLGSKDAARAEQVSRKWRTQAAEWKNKVRKDFPDYQGKPGKEESWKDHYDRLQRESERIKALINDAVNQEDRSIELENKGIFSLPSDFGNIIEKIIPLKEVRSLNLGNNELTFLPSSIKIFKNLMGLNIANNKLTHLPDWLNQLPLRALNITGNPLNPDSVLHYLNTVPSGSMVSVDMDIGMFNEIRGRLQGRWATMYSELNKDSVSLNRR